MKHGGNTGGGPGWPQSPQFRQIAREAAARGRGTQRARPRCGAHARSSGEPCKAFALANGRCRHHGGATPRGKRYGLPTAPAPRARDAAERLERKLRDVERRRAKRAEELAAMPEAERERAKRWRADRAPGDPTKRAAARRRRRENAEARRALAERPAAVSPEAEELAKVADAARAALKRLEACSAAQSDRHDEIENLNEGVFS